MMNKHVMIMFLLFSVSVAQAMWFKHKDKNDVKHDQKDTIHNLGDDVKRLKEEQLQYRSKHKALKDEPTDVRLGVVIENK
jgi:hypothetical protein